MELFARKGYEATSIADIAEAAGVAVGTVYRVFGDKQGLLRAIHEELEVRFETMMRASWRKDIPHADRFRPMIEGLFAEMQQQAHLMPLLAMVKEAAGGGESPSRPNGMVVAIAELIAEAIKEGAFRDVNLKTTSEIAFGMVDTAMRASFARGTNVSHDAYIDTVADMLIAYLVAKPHK
jgi:AcrR family transcriptional regulator